MSKKGFFKVECKSHPHTNSRVPWGVVELCCFEKISWARMVKILVCLEFGLEFVVCVYTYSHQCYASGRLVDRVKLPFKLNCDMRNSNSLKNFRSSEMEREIYKEQNFRL